MSDYKVLITHPERQHSHELATALEIHGKLYSYVHGAPVPDEVKMTIPATRRQALSYCRIGRVALGKVLPADAALEHYYRLIWSFDAWMSRLMSGNKYQAVVGYENAALAQFRQAKKLGLACVLDNSGVHHTLQDSMIPHRVSTEFHRRIVLRKDEELALADLVLTCSSFAAESFVSGGVAREKIRVVPLGCDTRIFGQAPKGNAEIDTVPRFLFVGRLNQLKGADLLAAAARQLRSNGIPFELTVAAALEGADPEILSALSPLARLLGKVSHELLPSVYANADCVVVPSRFDSFAFVVAEALASGVPVIVSDHVGAKDMIEEGDNGWIVPAGDVDALVSRMRWCGEHRNAMRTMFFAASQTAARMSWPRYHAQAASTLNEFMAKWL
ncbi:glycosyltransferase family 4 protein [Methylocystis sp.]|uniref:glycosyltransferase family 4 protein n=1 Tax=Methylocystis sp. TaxID=1911079 RepID=UPI003DA1F6A5